MSNDHRYTTGKDYKDQNIKIIMGDTERFTQKLYSPEDEDTEAYQANQACWEEYEQEGGQLQAAEGEA